MAKYIIQIKKSNRWRKTNWTRRGIPVLKRAAEKALLRAQTWFPEVEYRIREVK